MERLPSRARPWRGPVDVPAVMVTIAAVAVALMGGGVLAILAAGVGCGSCR